MMLDQEGFFFSVTEGLRLIRIQTENFLLINPKIPQLEWLRLALLQSHKIAGGASISWVGMEGFSVGGAGALKFILRRFVAGL